MYLGSEDMYTFLDFLKYLFLGLVQGVTEPLPISSSGHMVIFEQIIGINIADLNFKIIVNFGSLLAICFFYRETIKDLIVGSWRFLFQKKKEFKSQFIYVLLIVVATIPTGIIGLLIKDIVDAHLSSILIVGVNLMITGSLLMIIHFASKHTTRSQVTFWDAIWMGLFQAIALLPGISRSGSTSSIGVIRKLNLQDALRFSFMMYIPASLASLFLSLLDIQFEQIFILGYLGAFVVSLLGTFFAIKFFFKMVKKDNLIYFSYYTLAIGAIVLIVFGIILA